MADVYLGEKTMTYYSEHKEERDKYQREWLKKHPNYQKEKYAKNKEQQKIRHANYYIKNKEQHDAKERSYYWENREKVLERGRKYREEHKDERYRNREETNRKHREKYKETHPNMKPKIVRTKEEKELMRRNRILKKKFGITLEDYNRMRFEQDGCCAICGRHEDEFPLHQLFVDHNHKTGKVRRLICNNCNSLLGHARDDINVLYKAVAYLKLFE